MNTLEEYEAQMNSIEQEDIIKKMSVKNFYIGTFWDFAKERL